MFLSPRHPLLTLAQAMPDPCAPSVLHVFNLWSHEVAVVSTLYLEATYVNELLTMSLDLVLISLSDPCGLLAIAIGLIV